MEITVSLKSQYGNQVIVPVCKQARLFAELAGTRTLTTQAVWVIKAMGYLVLVQQEVVAL